MKLPTRLQTFRAGVLGLALAALAPAARADTTLVTGTLAAADGSRLLCIITNFDKKDTTATIEIVDPFTNTVLTSFGCTPLVVNSACFTATTNAGFKNAYCRVVSKSRKIRAVLWVQDGAGSTVSALQASK